MNTIKIYLAESGRIADLKKDFPLYQGQFQNKLLNIYVPTSLLAPDFKTLSENQTTSEYVAGTAVKIGMTYLARNGEVKVSKNYYMRYLKTLTYQNIEYALFERKLPQEFTLYAGQGTNAPTLIANVVNVDTDNDKILSIITSQTCSLEVMTSSSLDNDEAIEASELENINAQITAINEILPTKQDKTDEGLNTADKTVVGAINENKSNIDTNATNIETNTENIAKNTNDIDYLKQYLAQPEEYIGQMEGSTLPTDQQLTDFVVSEAGRQPKNADVVIFILQIPNATDKNYKYTYSASGWNGYEIPPMEQASNGTYGIVEGTYNIGSANNTLVDISGGEILNIFVKDTAGTYRNIREYINTNATNIVNIINGNTSVGVALRAIADGLGNNIVNTYLTQTAGATKEFVRDYALPREFNDIFYISKEGYSKDVPTKATPQFSVVTKNIGDFTLFDISKENDCEYELSRKNSADNSIFISANRDCIVTFRLTTQAKNIGSDWVDLDVVLSNPVSLLAGQIQRVDFASVFTYLGEDVLKLEVGDMMRQILEVVMQETTTTTFNVYSNETYPSIFNINVLSQVVYHTLGMLGEQPVYEVTPNGAITTNGISLIGSEAEQIYNNTECQLVINIPNSTQGYDLFSENLSILSMEIGRQTIRLATPYNLTSGMPTFRQLRQVAHLQDVVSGITYTMKCFVKIENGNTIFYVDEDDIAVVDSEIATINGEITTIKANLSQETSERKSADTTLQNNINSEATTRANADTTLQDNIDNEASTRASADTTLQSNIDKVSGNLATEITNRTNADSNLQSQITTNKNNIATNTADIATNEINIATNTADIDTIKSKIPAQASATNQLADKDFVNSSIATATATFRGTYNLVSDLKLSTTATHEQVATALKSKIATADNEDYCYVQIPTSASTPTTIASVDRYKYNGSAWAYEYTLNNSGFTQEQWNAINSGATATLVSQITTNKTNISALTTELNEFETATNNALAGKEDTMTALTTAEIDDIFNS